MSHLQRSNDANVPKHVAPESLTFSMFTRDQLNRLCVIKISTPLTLDPLGHPLNGGLYDKRLGTLNEKSEPCGTCRKNHFQCPGHFGRIDLPLPLVNPIFHKIIGILLKISCLNCHRFQLATHVKYTLIVQIKLLNCGLVTEALELNQKIQEFVSFYQGFDKIPVEILNDIKKYETLAAETTANLKGSKILNKNTEALRNEFINNTLVKEIKTRRVCLYCRSPIDKIQFLRNRIIVSVRGTDAANADMAVRLRTTKSKYMNPEESRRHLRLIWEEEKHLMGTIIAVLEGVENLDNPIDVFYMDVVPVVPPNMRPVNVIDGRISEHPRTSMYKSLMEKTILLNLLISVMKNEGDIENLSVESKGVYDYAFGSSAVEKLNNAWEALQYDVDALVDTSQMRNAPSGCGLKQIIEKKVGIIRMHMMGKRVNFSARSVITPDPNLNIDEIGIPEAFAKHLTYPVPVTSWNVEYLRKLITNGPDVHPGAVMVEYEDGSIKRITENTRDVILKQLLTPSSKARSFRGVKRVHRHLCNGDVLLLNRQPTLHKPSIMAHTARILKGEKTLRLHYSNCKAYNADFDGDEMNAHFPQNELGRSEAYNLVNVRNQYLVPKDGTPLGGLIQDHMIAGVKMSTRGRFFTKEDYHQLVFQSFSHKTGKIKLLPPAILKPVQLWSGKQILSTVIINTIPENNHLINLTAGSKIPAKAWQTGENREWKAGGTAFDKPNEMSESLVIIREGQLIEGVLDKTHYGATPYGLVHCIYELYGGACATQLLSSLAKLFTRFLQYEGFTLGVRDILTLAPADRKRSKIIVESRKIGVDTITQALGLPETTEIDEIVSTIEHQTVTNPKLRATIDRAYKSALDSYTNDINRTCLPAGLVSKFPQNNLQLMVQSGAKGSTVNTMQISCLLGQIELEGKRPPVMISGKTLPSFPIFEFAPRAGGFIDGRFMTGIQPQEFFFHCMAGREGLIDTAVKTSRSGYLQRCLVKHLEGLHVAYDMTVRDSDKTVVQYMYGEDGMDISKAQFLNAKQLSFLAENASNMDRETVKTLKNCPEQKSLKHHQKSVKNWCEEYGPPLQQRRTSPFALFSTVIRKKINSSAYKPSEAIKMWRRADDDIKETFKARCIPCPLPTNAVFQSDHHYGSLNERLDALMSGYKPDKHCKHFKDTFRLKAMTSLCPPGEPVGLLAAQSIGEPSTQMTLNTFHFAGRGEMNVTLGIPRLREILMMASKNIKTPSMEVPFKLVPNLTERAEVLRKRLTRVVVGEVLEKIDVSVKLCVEPARMYQYAVKFHFLPHRLYSDRFHTSPKKILKHMTKKFFGDMFAAIRKYSKVTSSMIAMEEQRKRSARARGAEDEEAEDEPPREIGEDEDSSEEEPEDTEDAKSGNKFKQTHDDQEPEEEEREDSDDENQEKPLEDETNEQDQQEHDVLESYNFAQNYAYDKNHYLWCELVFALPLSFKKLDLNAILKDVAYKSVIWETPRIKRAITYMKDDKLTVRTDGINILELCKYRDLLDLNRLYCNDIHKMAEMYGIEAARTVIVKEVKDVFNVYGIKVDPRHLSLISDYMTTAGSFEPMSRRGMESSASPLQQMSFEASLTFLKNTTIGAKTDPLQNPSSCLMVGKPNMMGTGSFQLFHKFPLVNNE